MSRYCSNRRNRHPILITKTIGAKTNIKDERNRLIYCALNYSEIHIMLIRPKIIEIDGIPTECADLKCVESKIVFYNIPYANFKFIEETE